MFLHFCLYLWILYSTLMHLIGIACASWLFKWIGQGFQPSNSVLIYSITESTVLPHGAYSLNTGMKPGAWHSKAKQTATSVWRKSGFDRSLEACRGCWEAQDCIVYPCLLPVVPTGSVLCLASPLWTPEQKEEEVGGDIMMLVLGSSGKTFCLRILLFVRQNRVSQVVFRVPEYCFHVFLKT